jgi:adenylosuccinate synthase
VPPPGARRCGWLDMVMLNNAVRLNGLTGLAITKLDVLGGLMKSKSAPLTCTGEHRIDDFPGQPECSGECEPVYESIAGWQEDISPIRRILKIFPSR